MQTATAIPYFPTGSKFRFALAWDAVGVRNGKGKERGFKFRRNFEGGFVCSDACPRLPQQTNVQDNITNAFVCHVF